MKPEYDLLKLIGNLASCTLNLNSCLSYFFAIFVFSQVTCILVPMGLWFRCLWLSVEVMRTVTSAPRILTVAGTHHSVDARLMKVALCE